MKCSSSILCTDGLLVTLVDCTYIAAIALAPLTTRSHTQAERV